VQRCCALAAIACVLSATVGCARFFFFPDRVLRLQPDDLGLQYRNVYFGSSDGTHLHGWLLPARQEAGEPRGTVVFMHGNGQNVSAHIASVYWMPAAGFHVFLFDYRGYGTSHGKPTLDDVHRDAEAALRRAATLPGVDPQRIVVFGQSLGGAIAATAVAHVRGEVPIRALVLDSAFSDFRGIAREKLAGFWLTWPLQAPLAWTVPDDFRPLEALASLDGTAVLIVHGEADEIIPLAHAYRMQSAAPPGTPLWIVLEAAHIQAFNTPEMRERLVEYLTEVLADATGPIATPSAP
jgi:hypothetical protein